MSVAACMVDLIVAHASMNVSMQSYIFAFYRKRGHIYKYIYKYMRISTVGPLPPAPHDYMPHAKAFGNNFMGFCYTCTHSYRVSKCIYI